jgi:hypothetical protein
MPNYQAIGGKTGSAMPVDGKKPSVKTPMKQAESGEKAKDYKGMRGKYHNGVKWGW